MLVSKVFLFEAAHQLTKYHGKCENLHGHTYKLIVTVEGSVQDDGMVYDFHLLKNAVKEEIVDRLDHTYLNDLMDNPSAELLVVWMWDRLKEKLPVRLHELQLWETQTSYVTYHGD